MVSHPDIMITKLKISVIFLQLNLGCPMIPEPSLDCAVSCGSQDFAKNKAQVENYLEEEEISDS